MSLKKDLPILLCAVCIAYLGFRWFEFVSDPQPQDFHVYYYSVQAHEQGLSPYSQPNLAKVSDNRVRFGFVYPPYTLPVLSVLQLADRATSARIYLLFKTLLLFALIALWWSWVKEKNFNTLAMLLIMISVGYYECVYRDFRHGNISTIEQFFLWFGAFFFLKGRLYLYAFFIFLASFFKLALIPFLGVLYFIPKKKGWLPFLFGSVLFLSLQASSYWLQPEAFMQFWNRASGLTEPGPLNPSMMMFSRATFGFLSIEVANFIYVVGAIYLTFVFWRKTDSLKKNWSFSKPSEETLMNLFIGFTLLYTLIMPRFKNYSYIMLIFPTLWILERYYTQSEKKKWLFVLLVAIHLAAYQSWILVFILFLMWLQKDFSMKSAAAKD